VRFPRWRLDGDDDSQVRVVVRWEEGKDGARFEWPNTPEEKLEFV
jgi:hypothetical protein